MARTLSNKRKQGPDPWRNPGSNHVVYGSFDPVKTRSKGTKLFTSAGRFKMNGPSLFSAAMRAAIKTLLIWKGLAQDIPEQVACSGDVLEKRRSTSTPGVCWNL